MSTKSQDQQSGRGDFPNREEDLTQNTVPSRPPSAGGLNASILSWASAVRILADAEPVTAAGVASLLVIVILFLFGRIGSLVIGVLAGLLIHAGLEKQRENVSLWQLTSGSSHAELVPQREVYRLWSIIIPRIRSQPSSQRRQTWQFDIFWTYLFAIMSICGLIHFRLTMNFLLHAVVLSNFLPLPSQHTSNQKCLQNW